MNELTKCFLERDFIKINVHTGELEQTDTYPSDVISVDDKGDIVYNTFFKTDWQKYRILYANLSILPKWKIDEVLNQLK